MNRCLCTSPVLLPLLHILIGYNHTGTSNQEWQFKSGSKLKILTKFCTMVRHSLWNTSTVVNNLFDKMRCKLSEKLASETHILSLCHCWCSLVCGNSLHHKIICIKNVILLLNLLRRIYIGIAERIAKESFVLCFF